MKILFLLFTLAVFARQALCQDSIQQFVKEYSNKINTISPDYNNDEDLKVIEQAIGSARVVMLGEQDHGDGPTYLAKGRLIKYLHDSLGFNVVAFESDFFALNNNWPGVMAGDIKLEDYFKGIYSLWTLCKQCNPVFQYIADKLTSKKPLIVTGFDSFFGDYSLHHYRGVVEPFLRLADIPSTDQPFYKENFYGFTDSLLKLNTSRKLNEAELSFVQKMKNCLTEILQQLKAKAYENTFQYITLQSLQSECRVLLYTNANQIVRSISERDHQMAVNLNWLMNVKYPKEKIIVWAANAHIMRRPISDEYPVPMGSYLTRMLSRKDAIYSIGFTDFSGTAGRVYATPYDISLPARESLENWLAEKDFNYAFINFQKGVKVCRKRILLCEGRIISRSVLGG